MALITFRDWLFAGLGLTAGFIAFTTIGRRAMLAGMGLAKHEAEAVIKKVEERVAKE